MSKEILVSVRSAESEGSCNVCQAKEGDIFLIDLPRSSFRICPICAYDLRQKLAHNIDAWAMAKHRNLLSRPPAKAPKTTICSQCSKMEVPK